MTHNHIKNLPAAILLCIVLMNLGCGKGSSDNPGENTVKNCDNLVTDTTGTGDKAIVVLPNAFTPNGDGINDKFRPSFKNISAFDFSVYDISNKLVYQTTTAGQGWQPAAIPGNTSTTYYYRVQATTTGNHKIGVCGNVHMITCMPKDSLRYFDFEDQLSPDYTFSLPTAESLPGCQ